MDREQIEKWAREALRGNMSMDNGRLRFSAESLEHFARLVWNAAMERAANHPCPVPNAVCTQMYADFVAGVATMKAEIRALAADEERVSEGDHVLWIWKNGRHEYWAFDNPYPCYDNGDPMTLGEPVGYALLKQSINGRPEVTHSDAVRAMLAAAEREPRP